MARGLALLFVLFVSVGVAGAQAKRKIKVETEPSGATVYVGDKENGPSCESTPCTIDVPIGEVIIVIEMSGFTGRFETLMVPKRGPVKIDVFTLEKAIGTIIVEGPKGARVTIDDVEKGVAPTTFEMPAGSYGVVLTLGEKTGSQFVDVTSGGEVKVDGSALGEVVQEEVPDEPTPTTPKGPRGPIVSLAVSGASGFRSFTYATPTDQRNAREGGTIIGVTLQVWPAAAFRVLPGLFIRAKAELPLYRNAVEGMDLSTQAETLWQHYEAGVHYQWLYNGKLGIQGGAAYMRDDFDYSGTAIDRQILPRTVYKSISIGAQVSYRAPVSAKMTVEPYLAFDNRIVLSGGDIETRYAAQDTSTSGFGGRIGAAGTYGSIRVRLEFSYLRFSWDFGTASDRMASTGIDSIKLFGFSAGYEY